MKTRTTLIRTRNGFSAFPRIMFDSTLRVNLHHSFRVARRMRSTGSEHDDNTSLSTEFAQFLNARQQHYGDIMGIRSDGPSHLMNPITCVTTVLNALQRCNWPEPGCGINTAFEFTWPLMIESDTSSSLASPRQARSWTAKEEWLDRSQFHKRIMEDSLYSVLVECDDWEFKGNIQFSSVQTDSRAIVPVHVTTAGERSFTFTFCLRRVCQGSLKGCWLIVGVRHGDYSL